MQSPICADAAVGARDGMDMDPNEKMVWLFRHPADSHLLWPEVHAWAIWRLNGSVLSLWTQRVSLLRALINVDFGSIRFYEPLLWLESKWPSIDCLVCVECEGAVARWCSSSSIRVWLKNSFSFPSLKCDFLFLSRWVRIDISCSSVAFS